MKNFSNLLLLVVLTSNIYTLEINLDNETRKSFSILDTDEIRLYSENYNKVSFIQPIKGTYSNINNKNKLELCEVKYKLNKHELHNNELILSEIIDFKLGTYYISWANSYPSLSTNEPLQLNDNTIQISVRDSNSLRGYLKELINTPFIYNPLRNSNGINQVDNRIGSDCASFVTYGLRRSGYDIPYTNPITLTNYLKEISKDNFYPEATPEGMYIYKNDNGQSFKIIDDQYEKGIIVSFRSQISVLYKDKGILGILDSEDLLIQSWYDGPLIVKMEECGFFDFPIRLYTF